MTKETIELHEMHEVPEDVVSQIPDAALLTGAVNITPEFASRMADLIQDRYPGTGMLMPLYIALTDTPCLISRVGMISLIRVVGWISQHVGSGSVALHFHNVTIPDVTVNHGGRDLRVSSRDILNVMYEGDRCLSETYDPKSGLSWFYCEDRDDQTPLGKSFLIEESLLPLCFPDDAIRAEIMKTAIKFDLDGKTKLLNVVTEAIAAELDAEQTDDSELGLSV